MRAFTLSSPGIAVAVPEGSGPQIMLGESGRGRHRVAVPVPAGGDVVDSKLLSVAIHGEGPNEVLLRVPDLSGFRGSSSSAPLGSGSVLVAEGRCAQGDAGAMGGGTDTLWRVADGATIVIRRSGRRIDWAEAHFTNLGGQIVRRIPAVEAEKDAAVAAFGGPAPVVSPEEAAAARELEESRRRRDGLAAEAAAAAGRRVEEIRAETQALEQEAWDLEAKARVVREEREAKARVQAARDQLGNGFGALKGLKL